MTGMRPIAEITRNVVVDVSETKLRTMAHQAAAVIETLDITPEQRCDLRMLPIEMLAIADALADARSPQ